MKTFLSLTLIFLALVLTPHLSPAGIFNKENTIGAAIGGIAGGVIGHQSGHKTEGAILGGVAGYAIGSVIQDEKQKKCSRHQTPQTVVVIEEAPTHTTSTPTPVAPEPRFTKSEERQLLLQSTPLFSVR